MDSKTGEEQWKFDTGGNVRSSPVLSDGLIYFNGSRFNNDVSLYALDAKTGEEEWKFEAEATITSSPTIVDGIIYCHIEIDEEEEEYQLNALDAKTGEEKWCYETGHEGSVPPEVADGLVYSVSDNCYLNALDAKTGEENWWFENENIVKSSPVVVDGTVYFSSNDKCLYALDIKDGSEQWKFKCGDKVKSFPEVIDGAVYFSCWDNHLYALDIKAVSVLDRKQQKREDEADTHGLTNEVIRTQYICGEIALEEAIKLQKEEQIERQERKTRLADAEKIKEEAIRKGNVVDMKIDELFKRLVVAIRNDTSADYSDALDLSDEKFMSDIENYSKLSVGTFTAEEIEEIIYNGLFHLQNWYQNEWLVDGETPLHESGLSGFKEDWRLNEINSDWNETVYNLINELDPKSILDYH